MREIAERVAFLMKAGMMPKGVDRPWHASGGSKGYARRLLAESRFLQTAFARRPSSTSRSDLLGEAGEVAYSALDHHLAKRGTLETLSDSPY